MSKINSHVIPVRATASPKTDAVFAYTKRGRGYRKVRVSEYMSYGAAVERYSRMEAYNRRNTVTHFDQPLGAGGGPIVYLAVRSKNDPNWDTAPRVTVVQRTKQARRHRAAVRAI